MAKLPLDGIRVADFSWFGAGPIAAQTLATFGAEVIRIESETHLDSLRLGQPFAMNADGTYKTGYNVGGYFNNFNAGKLSMQLNVNTEKGQEIAQRIVAKSDIFITNFTPRVITRWKLDYDVISKTNPRIIAAYAPMQGLDGPHRDFLGFGAVLTPVTGISHLSGFPERRPIGVGTNYPDYVLNPGHTITAVLAALRYRNRTGKGQRIELSQLESVVNGLGTAVADYLANGHEQMRSGNTSPIAAPHGAFRCADDPESVGSPDRWVAIACYDDAQWTAMSTALGHPEAATDARFATFAARKANEAALDAELSSWLRTRVAEDVMALLQSHGVPCGVVQNAQDMVDRDPHMKARGYYEYLDNGDTGMVAYDGTPIRLSVTTAHHRSAAPRLGDDTMDVCERIIGLTADEIADLLADGVLI
jgi:crotonobetainyl-CoA:carnitine CoA-transferase CaiB-like acyl-CoA transferase